MVRRGLRRGAPPRARAPASPERTVLHGNAKSEAELRMALRHRVGAIVIDNFDEIDRLLALAADGALADRGPQPVLLRVTPDVRGETHEKISTGQADSKFGLGMDDAPRAIAMLAEATAARAAGTARAHRLAAARSRAVPPRGRGSGHARGVPGVGPRRRARRALHRGPVRAAVDRGLCRRPVEAAQAAGMGPGRRLMVEPGRALCANAP